MVGSQISDIRQLYLRRTTEAGGHPGMISPGEPVAGQLQARGRGGWPGGALKQRDEELGHERKLAEEAQRTQQEAQAKAESLKRRIESEQARRMVAERVVNRTTSRRRDLQQTLDEQAVEIAGLSSWVQLMNKSTGRDDKLKPRARRAQIFEKRSPLREPVRGNRAKVGLRALSPPSACSTTAHAFSFACPAGRRFRCPETFQRSRKSAIARRRF